MTKYDDDDSHIRAIGYEKFSRKKDAETWANKVRLTFGVAPSIQKSEGKWIVQYHLPEQDDFSDLDIDEGRRLDYRRDSGAPEAETVIRGDHPVKGIYGD